MGHSSSTATRELLSLNLRVLLASHLLNNLFAERKFLVRRLFPREVHGLRLSRTLTGFFSFVLIKSESSRFLRYFVFLQVHVLTRKSLKLLKTMLLQKSRWIFHLGKIPPKTSLNRMLKYINGFVTVRWLPRNTQKSLYMRSLA